MALGARSQGSSSVLHVHWSKFERNLAVCALLYAAALLPRHMQAARTERHTKSAPFAIEDDKCAWSGSALLQGQRKLSEQTLKFSGLGGSSNDEQGNFPSQQTQARSSRDSCAELVNKGSHFTINVKVGNPPQDFDVVTDTGSNALIVRSCVCQEFGGCSDDQGDCFTGTGKSSSFKVNKTDMHAVVLSFGSGKIQAVVATDDVQVGGRMTRMHDSLLLMVARQLDLSGPFEGILGLGLPTNFSSQNDNTTPSDDHGMQMHGGITGGTLRPGMQVYGFMESANTQAFTVCFNDGANGVLRMDPPPPPVWLGTVGKAHWSLDFQGITVGNSTTLEAKVDICADKLPGQKTACGAIPDSGTTAIMGPSKHLMLLFEAICKAWPRCHEEATKYGTEPIMAIQDLLVGCSKWLGANSSVGSNAGAVLNEELPSLNFKLADESGTPVTITLDPVDYIRETMSEDLTFVAQHLVDIFPKYLLMDYNINGKRVCVPAFGEAVFDTKVNGPVWILGTPIFYKYQVGYNMSSMPPGISFSEEPCGTCQASLVSHGSGARSQNTVRAMQRVRGPLRVSNFDKSKGL